ncbi:glucose-6-phosphate isomerase [Solimonas marina]|uniref:Glucose-6-phosphate isomerase n=1 Tax=Solimonas marina TaxID=2714601 RepID=A0A969WB42_9GAMM|nr:glucose-6-phosphate isomerase [Solimonas marina]NKF23278.1 glucose-6-phosphate isomerase [Solimonas marina]
MNAPIPKSPSATPAWRALSAHAARFADVRIADLFAADPQRAQHYVCEDVGIYLDYSKQRANHETLDLLFSFARQQGLDAWRTRLFGGEHVNNTENRAALHMALRAPRVADFRDAGRRVGDEVQDVRERMAAFAERVRDGEWRGATGKRITDIVNIGIGGSDLGPRLVCSALSPAIDGPRPHFVANVDGAELHQTLSRLRPETTLFVVVSKTFATQETLANALHARAWLISSLDIEATAQHFVAVSTNEEAVSAFGIAPDNMFGFWDWVGGRYSLWSAVGLTAMVALGPRRFDALLRGAHAMDTHFRRTPLEHNLPVLLGLLAVWNHNFLGCASHVMAPYAQRLSLFSDWAQQLEMESNGKGVTRDGLPVDFQTTPVLWGNVGSNAQHAYFQMLHQGPAVHAVDFILPVFADHPFRDMHRKLTANCFAQASALMRGKTADEVREELQAKGLEGDALEAAIPHRVFPGNRPSNMLLIPRIDAFHLGALLALYEHRTFVESVLWGINAFDQWGVEFGKQLTKRLLESETEVSLDPSTDELMRKVQFYAR